MHKAKYNHKTNNGRYYMQKYLDNVFEIPAMEWLKNLKIIHSKVDGKIGFYAGSGFLIMHIDYVLKSGSLRDKCFLRKAILETIIKHSTEISMITCDYSIGIHREMNIFCEKVERDNQVVNAILLGSTTEYGYTSPLQLIEQFNFQEICRMILSETS